MNARNSKSNFFVLISAIIGLSLFLAFSFVYADEDPKLKYEKEKAAMPIGNPAILKVDFDTGHMPTPGFVSGKEMFGLSNLESLTIKPVSDGLAVQFSERADYLNLAPENAGANTWGSAVLQSAEGLKSTLPIGTLVLNSQEGKGIQLYSLSAADLSSGMPNAGVSPVTFHFQITAPFHAITAQVSDNTGLQTYSPGSMRLSLSASYPSVSPLGDTAPFTQFFNTITAQMGNSTGTPLYSPGFSHFSLAPAHTGASP